MSGINVIERMKICFGRVIDFFKKENKKVFSPLFVLVKIIFSILITILLPILFLVVFIFKEPREINSLNQYIDIKIEKFSAIKNLSYKSAKISLNKNFDIIYNIEDLDFEINSIHLNFPNVILKIKLWNLIKRKFFIDNIQIENFTTYFDYDGIGTNVGENKEKTANINLKYEEIDDIFHSFLDYFMEDRILFFNSLAIKNSSLYFFNKDIKNIDKVQIIENQVKINKKQETVAINFNLKTRINNKKEMLETYNNCTIRKNKTVNCEVKMKHLSIYKLTNVFKNLPNVESLIKNINGSFDLTFFVKLDDYDKIKNSDFSITSESGNFNLKQIFGGNINYKNLKINGTIVDKDKIILNQATSQLSTNKHNNKIIDFSMSTQFENKNFLQLNFDIDNAGIDELGILWPVFLDDLGIRNWVVEHFKTGIISKANANIRLNYDERNKKLKIKDVNSKVIFNNTFLDYYELFPPISNMEAEAIFTDKDMNIFIKSGKIENTNIKNGKIYTNFTSDKPSLLLNLESEGKVYELFYFIDNTNKNKIKKTVEPYLNGDAISKIKIDLPFENMDLSNVFLDIFIDIKNNNTFVFKDNSSLSLELIKKQKTNVFNTTINLKNTSISIPMIELNKEKEKDLILYLDINILNDKVLLENITSKNEDVFDLNGSGIIQNGDLKELYIDNIKYSDNNFNFKYINNDDIFIDISGINFHINKEMNSLKKNNMADNSKEIQLETPEISFNVNFENLVVNKKYNLKDINIAGIYGNNTIKNLTVNSLQNNNGKILFSLITTNNNEKRIQAEFGNLGSILNEFKITNKLLNGDLFFSAVVDKNNDLKGKIVLKNEFSVITKEIKDEEFFNYILNSDAVSERVKNDLKNANAMNFEKASAEIYIENNNLIKIKKLLVESSDFFGVGISGGGRYIISENNLDFEGLIAPVGKLNTLFGANKIPVINKILFGKGNAGLFTIGYTLKMDADNGFKFNLIPLSVMNSNSLKNLLLMLLLI